MDSIDLNPGELWGDAMEEDDIEEELHRLEREEEPSFDLPNNAADSAEATRNDDPTDAADAVDDDALASLQNLQAAAGAAKRVSRPRPKLDGVRLMGDRGLTAIMETMRRQRWKGKGHEVEDLSRLMQVYEHWGHRMFPKMRFDDIIGKVEDLGRKKAVKNLVYHLRLDMPMPAGPTDTDGNVRNSDSDDDRPPPGPPVASLDDRWDALVAEQGPDSAAPDDQPPSLPASATSPQSGPESSQATVNGSDLSSSVLSQEVQARIAANRQRALERLRERQMSQAAASQSQEA